MNDLGVLRRWSVLRLWRRGIVWGGLLLLVGCAPDMSGEYGKRVGHSQGTSVNGTSVLANLFAQAGARVRTSHRLGRTVERADVVVWFPAGESAPTEDVRKFFEEWLDRREGRTLVYVPRNYDALANYWEMLVDAAPDREQFELRRRVARARAAVDRRRLSHAEEADYGWFRVKSALPRRYVDEWEGRWSKGLEAASSTLVLNDRIQPPEDLDRPPGRYGPVRWQNLLTSNDETLVASYRRATWGKSEILVVANGSAFLNLPLVNPTHRQLAGRLLDRCAPFDEVVFLESGAGGPIIADEGTYQHHGLAAFRVWPLNIMLMHVVVLGSLLCISLFPIFGRPRETVQKDVGDFGRHVSALGNLLEQTHDRAFAQQRRRQYHDRLAPEGTSDGTLTAPEGTSSEVKPADANASAAKTER